MKKFKPYFIVSFGVLLIVLTVIFVVNLIYDFPSIAVIIGDFVCAIALLLTARSLIIRLIPHYFAEKRLEKLVQRGMEAQIAHFSHSKDDKDIPDLVFNTIVQQHDGLNTLEFSSVKPESAIDRIIGNCGEEMDVCFYRNGRQYIGFTGTLAVICNRQPYIFQIAVHTVSINSKDFAVGEPYPQA